MAKKKSSTKKQLETPNPYRPNGWWAFSNIMGAITGKGQLAILILGLIFAIIIIRLPVTDVSRIFFGLISLLKEREYMGWSLNILTITLSIVVTRYQRRKFIKDAKRTANEKSQLQENLISEGTSHAYNKDE